MKHNRRSIIWQNYVSWENDIRQLMVDILDDAVVSRFLAAPPKYVVSDDTSWLDDIVQEVSGAKVDVKATLAERLFENFQALRAFHGCCPRDISSYYRDGILPLDYERAERFARSHFLSDAFPEISEDELLKAMEECKSQYRGGHVYFEANEKFLKDHCGHYLLYGSEYLVAVAATLTRQDRRRDYRHSLKGLGTPTVFVCDVPLELISSDIRLELAGSMLEVLFEHFLNKTYRHPQIGNSFGFSTRKALEPEFIMDHYHPQVVRDPI